MTVKEKLNTLIEGILKVEFYYDEISDITYCPFCDTELCDSSSPMDDTKHKEDCIYRLAIEWENLT